MIRPIAFSLLRQEADSVRMLIFEGCHGRLALRLMNA
jgi:hypothetical protein